MSVRPLVVLWRDAVRDSGLDARAKSVAFALSTYMTPDGRAWASVETLAQGASMGVTTTRRALRRLEAVGLLGGERSLGGRTTSGGGRTNTYQATIPNPEADKSLREVTRPLGPGWGEVTRPIREVTRPLTTSNPADKRSNPAAAADKIETEIEFEVETEIEGAARKSIFDEAPNGPASIGVAAVYSLNEAATRYERQRLLELCHDRDEGTERVLASYCDLPEAVFVGVRESLERRIAQGNPPDSRVKYVVGALNLARDELEAA